MLERYLQFIIDNISGYLDQKLLLAVSGGVDSMVMLDLSINAGLNIAVAHVNHKMRGAESDQDAEFVKSVCIQQGIPCHIYEFTEEQRSPKNFQERARDIRYDWWNTLCETKHYSNILTAHHSSDSIESFFINLIRSAGIKGLSGIPSINGHILRPLSEFNKSEILDYAAANDVAFREDSSNNSDYYKRNLIRNKWLPFLAKDEPNIEAAIAKSISNLESENQLLQALVTSTIARYTSTSKQGYSIIDLVALHEMTGGNQIQLLYQYLRQYGFTYDNCLKCIDASTGAEYHSPTHSMLKDRDRLIIRQKQTAATVDVKISDYGSYPIDNNRQIIVSKTPMDSSLPIGDLIFPFTVRQIQNGDKFKPYGMDGAQQKVKDFLTNKKLDKWSKQSTLVVEKDNVICAILPYRVADKHHHQEAKGVCFLSISITQMK